MIIGTMKENEFVQYMIEMNNGDFFETI